MDKPGYWAVIPATVRYDPALPPNAKLLYGEITALSNAKGYCYAQNRYFSALFGLSDRSVCRLLAALAKGGVSAHRRPPGPGDQCRPGAETVRRVRTGGRAHPSRPFCRDPSGQKRRDPSRQKWRGE